MLGKPVPDFSLPSTGGTFRLSSTRGRKAVLYFYPKDNTQSFKTKLKFPFELLSDAEEAACVRFGVLKQKTMYGKKVRGIERSTFVLDANGCLRANGAGSRFQATSRRY